MPIHTGKDKNGPFVQWGHQKKYYYKLNNKNSFNIAKSKAEKQMKAIFANGYHESKIYLKQFNLLIEQVYNNLNI